MKFNISFIRRINVLVAGTISTAYVIGKSINTLNVKNKLELKKGNEVIKIPPKLQSLIDEVSNDLKLKEKKLSVVPFISKGSDVKTIGFPFLSSDVYIGIPEYYMLDEDEGGKFIALVDDKEIPPISPEFGPLKKSMTLSKEAKQFGIAHELSEALHSNILPCGIMPILITLNCNALSVVVEKIHKKTGKPLHLSNHCFIFFMGAWMYALLYDASSVYKEIHSDYLVADLGKSYVKGGIEYYEKMIKRNKIIKKLNKEAPYTEDGDINVSFIRTTHMSIKKRIEYLKNINTGKKESLWKHILLS